MKGSVWSATRTTAVRPVGPTPLFGVADRGPGIPAACTGRIFEEFYRAHDTLDKAVGRVLQDPDLQGLFRSEVGEEAALGELELVGEGADREPFEPYTARQPDRVVEDRSAGQRSLAHGMKKARPFVSVKAQVCCR